MTIFQFTNKIEEIFENEVKKLLPGLWDEDLLTQNFLIGLCSTLRSVSLTDLNGLSKVSLNAFKQRGSLTETRFGDIAIIVNIKYPDGEVIEGVGYLEAKKRAIGKLTFDAAGVRQLRRINANAPHARLLLYDYAPAVGFITTYMEQPDIYHHFHRTLRYLPVTHAVAVPINLSLKANHFDTGLYKFGLPFSHQIGFRYLYAQDLEFDEETVNASKGFSERMRLSSYVLTISIVPSNFPENDSAIVNQEVFERLK